MRLWIILVGAAFVASACLFGGDDDRCEVPSEELVSRLEGGLTVEGASLVAAGAARSIAYERMWFVAAKVQGPGFEEGNTTLIWGVNDLENPDFIWWANNRANELSSWGDEQYFTISTDGIGQARACSDRVS